MKLTNRRTPFVPISLALLTLAVAATGVVSCMRADAGAAVGKVFDGDSILLSDGREIRYIGIDAPETGGNRPAEYGGDLAADANEGLIDSKDVRLEFDRELTDHYGRTLAYVYVGEVMVNRELVRSGVALAVPYPPNLKHEKELFEAMDEARRAGRGLWAEPDRWMVSVDDAARYIGESKTVVGRVASTGEIGAGIFLNFGPDYRTDFTAFIPRDDLGYFSQAGIADPADRYRGKTLEITGSIYKKNGPSITLRHPDQIYVRE
jgi:micrococcal nuclease